MTHNRIVNAARGYIYSKTIGTSGSAIHVVFFSDTIVTSSKEQLYSTSPYLAIALLAILACQKKGFTYVLLYLQNNGQRDPVATHNQRSTNRQDSI